MRQNYDDWGLDMNCNKNQENLGRADDKYDLNDRYDEDGMYDEDDEDGDNDDTGTNVQGIGQPRLVKKFEMANIMKAQSLRLKFKT